MITVCNNKINTDQITDISITAVCMKVMHLMHIISMRSKWSGHHTVWFWLQFRPDFINLNPAHP